MLGLVGAPVLHQRSNEVSVRPEARVLLHQRLVVLAAFVTPGIAVPCDFAFPASGIKAEATPNTEMILIADVDIDLLRELNQFGSVKNLKDRRKDIFELRKR